jgi:hypothetical protein
MLELKGVMHLGDLIRTFLVSLIDLIRMIVWAFATAIKELWVSIKELRR